MRSGDGRVLDQVHRGDSRGVQQYGPLYVDIVCNAIYPQALFIIQGIIEAVIALFVMFLVKGIHQYVLKW